jgi:hypothetical protein
VFSLDRNVLVFVGFGGWGCLGFFWKRGGNWIMIAVLFPVNTGFWLFFLFRVIENFRLSEKNLLALKGCLSYF